MQTMFAMIELLSFACTVLLYREIVGTTTVMSLCLGEVIVLVLVASLLLHLKHHVRGLQVSVQSTPSVCNDVPSTMRKVNCTEPDVVEGFVE